MIVLSIPYLNDKFVRQTVKKYPHYWKEFRLDYSKDFKSFPIDLINEQTIITVRSLEEGGIHRFDLAEKIDYFKQIIDQTNCLCDLEIYHAEKIELSIPKGNLILSYHDHSLKIDFKQLASVISLSNSLQAKFVKIALNIANYSDFIRLSKLISKSNKPVIFAGMGKLGKISRSLHKHLNADSTFIGLSQNPTAEGQLTPIEVELYHLHSITKQTQVGGIIGGEQIEHSLGLKFYNEIFLKNKLDAIYLPFLINKINDFWNWIKSAKINFYGFSVTMPYKKQIGEKLKHDIINLFLPKTNEMFNTDLHAFQQSIEILKIKKNDSILIMGSGATAETALKAFNNFDNILIYSRNKYTGINLAKKYKRNFVEAQFLIKKKFDILINCTSLGYKNENILDLLQLTFPSKVIELPYIQKNTLLINKCIENEIDHIDGKKFWKLQAKVQQQKFLSAISDLEE